MAETAREAHLRRLYGISLKQYDDLLDKQNGGCAICGKTPEEEGRNLAVDHLHKAPFSIRGILCNYCNRRVIGRHTDPELLRRMAEYLERDTGLFAPPRKRKRKKPLTRRKKNGR